MDVSNAAQYSGWWFSLSLVNAGLAEGKGRSRLNWWLISLLIGPIATLLIVVWPPRPALTYDYPAGSRS